MPVNDPFVSLASDPSVVSAVAEARAAVDRLLGHRILRRRSAEVSSESALRGARASAALEGVSAPLEDVRAGLVSAPLMQGALRVSAELGSLAATWHRAPRQALARLHVLAAADSVDPADLGRPRSSLSVHDPLDLGTPPSPAEVAARLDALTDLLITPTKAPAIVVAAIVHGELLALRPFGHADGIIARAATRLTLIDRGLDPKSLAAPEVGHAQLADQYAPALHAYLSGDTPTWILHTTQALQLGAQDTQALCEALQRP